MAYDVHTLSKAALQKIKLVLEHIALQMEIQGIPDHEAVEIDRGRGIEGVDFAEQKHILRNLVQDGILISSPYDHPTSEGWVFRTCRRSINSETYHIDDILTGSQTNDQGSIRKAHDTFFETKSSTLYVQGEPVKIAKRKEETKAHTILNYIFNVDKRKPDEQHFYVDIAEEAFGQREYDNEKDWRQYDTACRAINEKIKLATSYKINDFLDFSSGQKAYVRVKSEYL